MDKRYEQLVLNAVINHPKIIFAAVTGSQVFSKAADQYSDLDLLLIVEDSSEVKDINSWLPEPERILISTFHLNHYCSTLIDFS